MDLLFTSLNEIHPKQATETIIPYIKNIFDNQLNNFKSEKIPYGLFVNSNNSIHTSFIQKLRAKIRPSKPKLNAINKGYCHKLFIGFFLLSGVDVLYNISKYIDNYYESLIDLRVSIKQQNICKFITSNNIETINSEFCKVIYLSELDVFHARHPMSTTLFLIEKHTQKKCSHKHVLLIAISVSPTGLNLLLKEYTLFANNKPCNTLGLTSIICLLRQFHLLHPIQGQTKVWKYTSLFAILYPRLGDDISAYVITSHTIDTIEHPEQYIIQILKRISKIYQIQTCPPNVSQFTHQITKKSGKLLKVAPRDYYKHKKSFIVQVLLYQDHQIFNYVPRPELMKILTLPTPTWEDTAIPTYEDAANSTIPHSFAYTNNRHRRMNPPKYYMVYL